MTGGRRLIPFSILDRYVLSEFLRFYGLALGGFVGFILLVDGLEKIDTFIDHEATWSEILRYYANIAPHHGLIVAPVAPLLATFLSLGSMTRFRELLSVKAAGISLVRLFIPVYAVGLILSGLTFLAGEFVMPSANRRAREIMETDIRGRSSRNLGSRLNVKYLGEGNRFYVIRRYDIPRETMVEPMIQEFDGERLARRLDAARAEFHGEGWVLYEGLVREFDREGRESASPFDSMAVPFPERPEDFAREESRPEEMSFPQLRDYARRVRQSGSTVGQYETELHLRVAFSFANLVVILIASSLAVQMRRGGVALGFGLSLAIAFAYWCFIRAGQVLGNDGTLPPMLGAWLGNIVFLGVGGVLLARAPK